MPEEFASYEEAAKFWDTHDTTDYSDSFEAVAVEAYLNEIDEELMKSLSEQAKKGVLG